MSVPPTPPPAELITDRLVLPPWPSADIAAALAADHPAHWAEDFPDVGDSVVAGLFATHPEWHGPYGHRQLVERATGLVVGSMGLFWPPVDGSVELGYGVVPSVRGRGYAPEAVCRLTEHAFTAPGVRRVRATVDLVNPPSARVLEKAGFRRAGTDLEQGTVEFHADAPARPGAVAG